MSPQRSADITASVILILLAGTVFQQAVGHRVVKLTCQLTFSPQGNFYYRWFRDYYPSELGCSFSSTVWIDSTSSAHQDRYTCDVTNMYYDFPVCQLGEQQWGVTYTANDVCALEGSSVDLSCSYKHPGGLTVTRSYWFIYKQRGVDPVDLRDDDQYKGRVQYYLDQNRCRMTINGLRASDARTYWFKFFTDDPDGEYTGAHGVRVSVTDHPKIRVNTYESGKRLTCISTCNLPNPTYTWYRNGELESYKSEAMLYLWGRTVDAGRYSCTVKGQEEIRSAAVCVYADLQVKVEGAAVATAKEQTITLTCSPMGSMWPSTYTWYRNEEPVSECRSSSCSVAVVSGEVRYSCAAGRTHCSPPVYPPKHTRATLRPSGGRVEGDSVTLSCSSDADPPVITFYWFKQRPAADEALGIGQDYSITNISSQHSGLYYCIALNQLGHHSSAPARLDVFYAPRPPSLSEFNGLNGSLTLVCVSDSNPLSSYTWIRRTEHSTEPFTYGSDLTLAAGTGGAFYCTAKNQYGSSNSSEWLFTAGDQTNKDNAAFMYPAFGVIVVLLLIFIPVFLWMRKYRRSEENSVSKSFAAVYETVSDLAMTSGPTEAMSSDDKDEIQYSTVQFKHSYPQEEPFCSTVYQTHTYNEEEEVQYATVNHSRPGAAR